MIGYLPIYERKSKVFNELINAEAHEIQLKYEAIEDFKLQLSIDTATWGLDYYEKEFKIQSDHSKPYEHRRSVIKSKMRIAGKCDRMLIKFVCDAYTNGDVEVSFNGHIVIRFTSLKGIPPNINDLEAILEEIKPAHKPIDFEFTYNTHDMLKVYTHDALKAFTHDQIKTM
jgi:hypothetical protein